MEHAFWQRHRYLYDLHVFLYSNSYRILLTNITEFVNQSCQTLLKSLSHLPSSISTEAELTQAMGEQFQTVYSETLNKGKEFFRSYYATVIQQQIPLLYQDHLVAIPVKKLASFYTQKQLYDLFLHRQHYFEEYCRGKLQQLM